MREGSYPPPPYWPERLTRPGDVGPLTPWWLLSALFETAEVRHIYLADGDPGPCWTEWTGEGEYLDWHPALTIERAERFAAK